jgi:hypothetical protein
MSQWAKGISDGKKENGRWLMAILFTHKGQKKEVLEG